MQENTIPQSTVSSEQSTVLEQKTPITVHGSQNTFLVVLLSVLLFVSVSIAGFFAYQTQKLVNELRVMSGESKPTPVATETPDPTADWKTYNMNRIDFKYPKTYFVEPQSTKSNVTIFSSEKGKYYIGISEVKTSLQQLLQTGAIDKNQLSDVKIPFSSKGYYMLKELKGTALPGGVSETIYLIDQGQSYVEIRFWNNTGDANTEYELFKNNVDLILSTISFKG